MFGFGLRDHASLVKILIRQALCHVAWKRASSRGWYSRWTVYCQMHSCRTGTPSVRNLFAVDPDRSRENTEDVGTKPLHRSAMLCNVQFLSLEAARVRVPQFTNYPISLFLFPFESLARSAFSARLNLTGRLLLCKLYFFIMPGDGSHAAQRRAAEWVGWSRAQGF